MIFRGHIWKFGDDVDTDVIIPVTFCGTNDAEELGRHCMAGIDPAFPGKVNRGDIVVAGRNFGCGSSREPAPISIRAAGISCIVAKSFARIFYRNSFNIGLPLFECTDLADEAAAGDLLEVEPDTGELRDVTLGKVFMAKPIPPFMQDLLRSGGLMSHVAKRLGL